MSVKASRRQISMAYWAGCVQEWRGKGIAQTSINRMLIEMVEYSKVHYFGDAAVILEIADGKRAA